MLTHFELLLSTACIVVGLVLRIRVLLHYQRQQPTEAAGSALLALLVAPVCVGAPPSLPIDIVVGLPLYEGSILRNPFRLTIAKSQPVFDVAIEDIYLTHQLLPSGSLRITYVDTNLSDAIGPQRIIERYCARSMDAVMGMSYVYALAPVARMSQFWEKGVPVFTTSAMVDELGDKEQFPLLTRLMGTYKTVAQLMLRLVNRLRWRRFHFFFHDEAARRNVLGRSECFFSLNAIKNVFNHERDIVWTVEMFSESITTLEKYREMLKKASMQTNSKCC
ncbi:Atrial natriuretic peptide receptor 3 [Toxocara canis]|uniref:Atrial natriuretic peptide receptor 3 n=1 Tax=Toxocara canis TaxID=6265 RepID=A0A0B2VCE1_TOXCA|nr:Atrial natriuretic peptide receptor 3 [Toxocara canis]